MTVESIPLESIDLTRPKPGAGASATVNRVGQKVSLVKPVILEKGSHRFLQPRAGKRREQLKVFVSTTLAIFFRAMSAIWRLGARTTGRRRGLTEAAYRSMRPAFSSSGPKEAHKAHYVC
jgi:hypothetical protein